MAADPRKQCSPCEGTGRIPAIMFIDENFNTDVIDVRCPDCKGERIRTKNAEVETD